MHLNLCGKTEQKTVFYAFIYIQLTILHQRYYWCYWQISSMAGTLFLAFIKELNHVFSHFSAPRHILHISPLLLFLLIPLPPALEAMTTCASGWGFHCIALNVSWMRRFLFEINLHWGWDLFHLELCQKFWQNQSLWHVILENLNPNQNEMIKCQTSQYSIKSTFLGCRRTAPVQVLISGMSTCNMLVAQFIPWMA